MEQYEPLITPTSNGMIHHMEVFACIGSKPVRLLNGPCNSESKPMGLRHCRKVMAAWAAGATALPSSGIYVFASQLHTHSRGRAVVTYHLRGIERLRDLNKEDNYSAHYQPIRQLRTLVHVKQGDTLITKCTYSTINVTHVVFGGIGQYDEMCVNYIFYYPWSKLELCKSEVAQPEFDRFLSGLIEQNKLKGDGFETDKQALESIDWQDSQNVASLVSFYRHATMEMHCNSSIGIRIPGPAIHWSPIPLLKWTQPF
ncbi:unnamed protein product [Dicrocoelium dendriticum]|nr:unnamed protein product [Dicrocoelium dendriticum]